MNRQKLYFRLYEKGKWYISKHWSHKSKVQQSRFLLPAIVNPTTRFSTRDKVWLSIGVFFGIVYMLAIIVSMQVGARQAIADQRASIPATTFSSSTNPSRMARTIISNPPPISMRKLPSTLPAISVPAARPTPPVTFNPTPTPCPGVNCNPWGYNFIPGTLIYNPPVSFCNYFACVPNFNQPHHIPSGYVVECNDGMYSQFVGRRATCILHGGMMRPLYAH
jgi:hypothetical protein